MKEAIEGSYKYFIGYLMLPKTSAYVKSYDGRTKRMYFLIDDDDLLEEYDTIWDKIRADLR